MRRRETGYLALATRLRRSIVVEFVFVEIILVFVGRALVDVACELVVVEILFEIVVKIVVEVVLVEVVDLLGRGDLAEVLFVFILGEFLLLVLGRAKSGDCRAPSARAGGLA